MIDKIDTPTTDWSGRRECKCGCDSFRFRVTTAEGNFYEKTCRNCGHPLSDHISLIRSRQAD